jgi:hypothetical protein
MTITILQHVYKFPAFINRGNNEDDAGGKLVYAYTEMCSAE